MIARSSSTSAPPVDGVSGISRRALLTGGVGLAAALGLAACSSNDDGSGGGSGSGFGSAGSGAAGASGSAAATRTVEHKYGTTKLSGEPSRVVTLGYTDQEPVLALGATPVGVVDFFEERPYGKWPWTKQLWAGHPPQIVGTRDDYNFEKIAALHPDLIIGMYSGMTNNDYGKLTRIAPTVAQPLGHPDFSAPWTQMTTQAGRSLGREAQATTLITGVQARFAAARKAHPEWKGKTVAVAEPFKPGQWAVFGASDPKLQFFEGLGFTVAPSVRKLEPGGDVPKISTEQLDLLEVDQLVLLIDTADQTEAQVKANPLYAKLGVARENRTIFLPFGQNPPIGAALAFNSVLSIRYGITNVVAALGAEGS